MNGTARGTVYAPLEGLLNSCGQELSLHSPAPPDFNIEGIIVFRGPVAVKQFMHHRGFPERKLIAAKSRAFYAKVRKVRGERIG